MSIVEKLQKYIDDQGIGGVQSIGIGHGDVIVVYLLNEETGIYIPTEFEGRKVKVSVVGEIKPLRGESG